VQLNTTGTVYDYTLSGFGSFDKQGQFKISNSNFYEERTNMKMKSLIFYLET